MRAWSVTVQVLGDRGGDNAIHSRGGALTHLLETEAADSVFIHLLPEVVGGALLICKWVN